MSWLLKLMTNTTFAPKFVLWLLLACGLSMVAVGTERYWAGRTAERAVQEARINKLRLDAAEAKRAADEQRIMLERAWRGQLEGAMNERNKERAAAQRMVAAVAADRDRMRDELAAAAAGRVQASADTVEACRERASAFGDVLAEALRVGGSCAAEAEGLAADVRALLDAWPVTPAQ